MNNEKLWAPWRIHYVQSCNDTSDCFLCRDLNSPDDDDNNLVLWRTARSIVVLNHFPYNNGHLLIAPARHIPSLDQATDEEMLELNKLIRESQKALSLAIKPHGFNVGMNFGRCAGAGLPDHMHTHVVPRWEGDTNFINVCSDSDVISQSLTELLKTLKQISAEHNLPDL
ncbi:MAG: HIT family protein [Planctomycetota bacterium]